ncbi:MAG: DNA polymerase III subunit [Lachnospiraceae bacterium]|nr:DNA polymerase III subunit [Lachnospiraceae bacterium]
MKFSDIIGQDAVKAHLQRAVRLKQPSQAYILEGEKLSGKKTLANAFAAALLCERGGDEPCGECHSCKMAASGNHPDIIRVMREKKSNEIKIGEIRTQVTEDVAVRPYYGPYKIYIIDEAEKINLPSQNALLKTLEDPPAYAVLLLLATSMDGFLQTVLSRCIKLSLTPLSDVQVTGWLMRNENMPEYEAKVISAFAQGNLGKAGSLAESEDFAQMRQTVVELLAHMDDRAPDQLLADADALDEAYRERMTEIFDFFVIWYRDVLVYKALEKKEALTYQEDAYAISQAARRLSYRKLKANLAAIAKAREHLAERVGSGRVMQQLLLEIR